MGGHYRGTPRQRLALDTYVKLNRATETVGGRLVGRRILRGLTVGQFGALEALYHLGPMCQHELSAKVLSSTSNMTVVLDHLETRRLVDRSRNTDDRRKITLTLTPAGRQVMEAVLPAHVEAIVEEMGALSEAEQRTLGELCRKLGLHGAAGKRGASTTP